jgi:hypothetical protein
MAKRKRKHKKKVSDVGKFIPVCDFCRGRGTVGHDTEENPIKDCPVCKGSGHPPGVPFRI